MDRRRALWMIAGAFSASVLSPDLLAFGQRLHAQLPAVPALQTLSPHQGAMVATMAELIIPATDTPGARAARVHEFIDLLLTEWCVPEDRALFLAGLEETDRRSQASHGRDFLHCTEAQQNAILAGFDYEVARLRELPRPAPASQVFDDGSSPIKHFFFMMKRLTLIGYYTSEVGAQQEMHFEMIPPRFRGCGNDEEHEQASCAKPVTIASTPQREH